MIAWMSFYIEVIWGKHVAELKQVLIPDIGDFKDVPVIEVLVKAGDEVKAEDSLVTLESDKATIEIPSPYSGVIKQISVKPGDKVSEGKSILTIETSDDAQTQAGNSKQASADLLTQKTAVNSEHEAKPVPASAPAQSVQTQSQRHVAPVTAITASKAHASPSIRRFARELGVNLDLITGSGPKHRILKEDVQAYVKSELSKSSNNGTGLGLNLLPWPQVNFAKFGPIELKALTRIKQISGANLHRN